MDKMRRINNLISNVYKTMEQLELLIIAGGSVNNSVTLENYLSVSHQLTQTFSLWPRNSTSGIFPRIMKAYVHKKRKFITALIIMIKTT
jgi:hypothetical protein